MHRVGDPLRRRGITPVLLTINGEAQELPVVNGLTGLLRHLGVQGTVAVELNGTLVRRQDQSQAVIRDGDRLEIVHFVGGG